MIDIVKYESDHKSQWDEFIRTSKNGSFLFFRDYMEYHSDRFLDSSLLFFQDNDLIAVMPANVSAAVVHSHEGLTFGGVISNEQMKTELMLDLFGVLMTYLNTQGITTLVYKPVPHMYHTVPAEEDLYALFRYGATLVARDVAFVIPLNHPIPFSNAKKSSVKRAKKKGLTIKQTTDFETFMSIEETVLRSKYNVAPTHTSSEIATLAKKFPENIKLFAAYKGEEMLAGIIIYDNRSVVHGQYAASTEVGKKMRAEDLLSNFLMTQYSKGKTYYDCGRSTEKGGTYLNRGLAYHKEGFGARAAVYDIYEVNVAKRQIL